MREQTVQTVQAPAARPSAAGVAVGLRGVRREFAGGVVAVQGADLEIPAGQFLALLGPSGCGKSTLLRLVAGLDQPNSGTVNLEGKAGGLPRGSIAFVFQDAHLLPWRNVEGNVALPLELWGTPKSERLAVAREAIALVGLSDAARRYPAQLSGGMRMRVSLARALVTRPRLLLLDEPFGALDELTRNRLDEQLLDLWQAQGMTVLFVTHSISEAAFLAQRVVVMSPRPGRIVADRVLELPAVRRAELRTEAAFARVVQRLFADLREGGS